MIHSSVTITVTMAYLASHIRGSTIIIYRIAEISPHGLSFAQLLRYYIRLSYLSGGAFIAQEPMYLALALT